MSLYSLSLFSIHSSFPPSLLLSFPFSLPPSTPCSFSPPSSASSSPQILEKHLLDLLGRLDDFELLREQLEVNENPENLNEARDAVRRHVEAKQRLDKSDLDSVCEAINNTIVKLFPCTNGDFLGWLNFVYCSSGCGLVVVGVVL